MPGFLTEADIARLLSEPKPLAPDFRHRMALRTKRGHSEAEIDVTSGEGNLFRIKLRKSLHNPLDFSAILGFLDPSSGRLIRLRRYNGKSHVHTNPIEQDSFYDFHIHTATERYQRSGNREDTFAEITDRYVNPDQALDCLISDCGFALPEDPQASLFEEHSE